MTLNAALMPSGSWFSAFLGSRILGSVFSSLLLNSVRGSYTYVANLIKLRKIFLLGRKGIITGAKATKSSIEPSVSSYLLNGFRFASPSSSAGSS